MLQPRGWRTLAALLAVLLLAGSAAPTEQSLLDSSTNEHYSHEFETESLPLERVKRKPEDVTTIYLDENGSGREGRNYNRGLGLLTSTTRTFVNDGTTTEFATQIIGTKLGPSYAHVVATSSRVIYAADSRPKSYIDNAILPPKPAAHIIFATKDNAFNFQNDLFSYIHEDDKSVNVNTETTIESKPNPVLKSSYDFPITERSLNPLTIDPESENLLKARRVELLTKKRMTEENSSENNYNDVKPARVVPLDDTLPTFTVKHDFAPSGFSFEQEQDEKKFKEPTKSTRPRGSKALFRGGIKLDHKKYDTVTYHGFADFTTTVGDTVIIFMPKTAQNSLKATKQDTSVITSVKTFMSHSPGMVTRTITGHSLSMQTSLPTMVVDSEQSMIRENKAYPQYVSLTKNSEEKTSTQSTIETENFEAKSSILSQEQDMDFTSILEPSSSFFDLTSSLLPESSITLEPSETSTEQITTLQATESLATFATTQTQAFVSPDAINPLGLIKVLAGTRAFNETTTQFTSLIYGTVIDDTYSQVVHATSSVFYLEEGEKIFINPTKVELTQNPAQTISSNNDIQTTTEENIPTSFTEEITTENNEVETGRKINILPNDQIIIQDKEDKPVLKPSLITQVIPSTAYKTFTYLTTFYIPAEGSSTTSIRSREVTSTEIIQVTKVVPGGFESSYSSSILKESESTSDNNEQLLTTTNNELPSTTPHVETTTENIPLATFIETTTNQESTYPTTDLDKSTTNSEYGSTNIEEVTNPITEEISVSEVTNSNDISEANNQETTKDTVESITNLISETETTTVKLHQKETESNNEHTTESIKKDKKESTSSAGPGEITKEISSSIETTTPLDGEQDEIELIFKTVYTTYTYLTTFFQKSTSSVSSRFEVITNVVTTTADKEFLESSNSVVAGLFERENSEIIPTSVGIGRPTETYNPVNNIDDTDFSTVDSIDIEAEKEKLFPTPVLEDNTPKTYYTTYTYFTTIFVDGETEIESRTEIYTNIVSPSSVEKSTIQTTLSDLDENDQISEADHLESPPIISLSSSSTIKRTPEISLSKQTSQYHYNTISRSHNKPQSQVSVTINNEIIDQTNLLEASKAPISSRAVIESIDMSSSSSSRGQVAVLLEDQISSESNTEEIEPSPTLLLKTSYTTFTYFTTMYKGSTSEVVSKLETITNVDTETIHLTPTDISSPSLEDSSLPITYFTTYTYWTTLFKDGSTVVTSREETISNIVTPTLTSSILSILPTETYTPLVTSLDTSKLEEHLTVEPEIDNSLKAAIKESENVDIPIIPTQAIEGTTYYTTYTYFTTSYIANSTVVNSRLETITSIVNSTELVQSEDNDIQTGRAVPNGANAIQTENTKNAALLPTGLLSTLITSEVNDKTTTLFSTDVFGTYIDGLYAKVLESTTQILTSNIPSLTIGSSQVEPTMTTGVVSLNEGKIIDADSISTTYFTTKAIGTYIDNLYAQVIESSTSLVVDSDKQSLLSTNIDSKSHRTGLVRLIEGTIVKDHTTTFYESRVIGTVIEGRYAQIIESTSSFKLEMTSTSSLIEPSTVSSSTSLTPTSIVPTPTPTIESSVNNENSEEHINEEESNEDEEEEEEEEEEEDGNNSKSRVKSRLTFSTRKRTFTPVIRPFSSRNRPTFNPKRKTANASTATTITRTTLTPTITATPALKTEGFGNSRNRFVSNKKQNSSQNSGLNEVRPSSSRRFSRVKSSATGGFSSSSNYRGKSSLRISPTSISPNSASSRRGGFFRSSSNRIGISSQSKGSSLPPGVARPRIRPTLSSRLSPGATTTTSSNEDTQSDEDLLTTVLTDEPQTSSDEDIATGPISTTTEAFRRSNNPLLRFRRPPNIQAAPRSTTPRSSTTSSRRNPLRRNESNKATTTTPKPTTKRASFAFQRPRPPNNLFPRRGLLKKEENKKEEILEESEEENKEENQETSLEEPASDNDYEGSEPSESTAEANRRSGKAFNPVQIRPFAFRRRTKRQSEYGSKNNQPFIPRFRRPSSRKVAQDRIDVSEEPISEAPTAKPRYTSRPRNNGASNTKIRPTTASSNSGRSQFTLREKEPTGTTRSSSSPSFRRSKSGTSNRRRTTAKTELPQTTIPSRPKPPRLRNQTPRTTEEPYTPRSTRRYSNNNSNNSPRTQTRSRSRSRYRQENNSDLSNFNYQPNNDGTITVTYHIPTEVTIPVVNGKITEYKNIITASLSTEIVGPLGYTSLNGKDGKDTLVLTNEISSTLPGGNTEVTHYILHTKPTTSVIFTPTTIRGRKTSFSHIIPSTVYSVEPYVSTIQPNIAANAPLANILLSQLLLGNLGGIPPNINPLLGINQPTATPASPTTEFHTKTTTYVTTVTKGTSTVLPLTFRGKEILTTIVDQSEEVITATEFITETVVITPTVQQANQQQLNSLLLPALLQAQILGNQQTQTPANPLFGGLQEQSKNVADLFAEPIRRGQPDLDQNFFDTLQNDEQDVTNDYEKNNDEALEIISPKPKTSRKKQRNQNNEKKPPDPPSQPSETSVITLYVSGRRPGEFSTVLSTVTLGEESSAAIQKREVKIEASQVSDFTPSTLIEYDSNSISPFIDIGIESSETETQSLESIVGDVKTHLSTGHFLSKGPADFAPIQRKVLINTSERGNLQQRFKRNLENIEKQVDEAPRRRRILVKIPRRKTDDILSNSETQRIETLNMELDKNVDKNIDINFEKQNRKRVLVTRRRKIQATENQTGLSQSNEESENINSSRRRVIITKKRTLRPSSTKRKIVKVTRKRPIQNELSSNLAVSNVLSIHETSSLNLKTLDAKINFENQNLTYFKNEDIYNKSISKNIFETKPILNDYNNTDKISENKTDSEITTESSTIVFNDTSNLKELNFDYSLPIISEIESSLSEIEISPVIQETTQILPGPEIITSVQNFTNTIIDSENTLSSTNIEDETSTPEDGPRFVRPTRFSVTRKPQRTKPTFANSRRRTSTNEFTEQTSSNEFTSTFSDTSSKANFKPKKTSTTRKFGRKTTSSSSLDKIHSTTRIFRPSTRIEEPIHSETQTISPSLSSEEIFATAINSTETSSPLIFATKVITTTRLRTYTFIVTRVAGTEHLVTSTTEVRPHTKTITITESLPDDNTDLIQPTQTMMEESKTLTDLTTTYSSLVLPSEEGRGLDMNASPRYNLATKIMSNGVEVIVAGDKSTLPGDPEDANLGVISPSATRRVPVTLPPSTLTDHMIMYLPAHSDNHQILPGSKKFINDFVTKTYLTTITYETSLTKDGFSTVSTNKKVISNIVTEERTKVQITPTPSLGSGVTFQSSPVMATMIYPTMYTYTNVIDDSGIASSTLNVENTLTFPAEYITLIEPSEIGVRETNTYHTSEHNQKMTQVVVTETAQPTPVLSQIQPSTTDVIKTYFVTYTYYNTIVNNDGNTVVKSEVATSSDVFTEKFYLNQKRTTMGIEPTSTTPVQILATKTFLTTFTYLTTLLKNGKTSVSSSTSLVQNIVTETLDASQLSSGYIESLQISLNTDHVFKQSTAVPINNMIHSTQASSLMTSSSIKPNDIITGSTIIFFDEHDQVDSITTNNINPTMTEFAPLLSTTTSKSPIMHTSILAASTIMPNGAILMPGDQIISINLPDGNVSKIPVLDPGKHRPGYVIGHGGIEMEVSDILSLGSLGINAVNAFSPVIDALPNYFNSNDEHRRNDSISERPQPVYVSQMDIDFPPVRSPVYIPVEENKNIPDTEVAESQNYEGIVNVNENIKNWNQFSYLKHSRRPDEGDSGAPAPILGNGIPIRPGQLITTNSDVIVGKPSILGPRPHLAHNNVPLGMKPPPPPKSWEIGEFIEHKQNKEPIIIENSQISPPKTSHRVQSNTFIPKYPNNNPPRITISNNHQKFEINHNTHSHSDKHNNQNELLHPAEGSILIGQPPFGEHVQDHPPIIGEKRPLPLGSNLVQHNSFPQIYKPEFSLNSASTNIDIFEKPIGIEPGLVINSKPPVIPIGILSKQPTPEIDGLLPPPIPTDSYDNIVHGNPVIPIKAVTPTTIDRSSGMPLLVNLQPSQITNVLIPNSETIGESLQHEETVHGVQNANHNHFKETSDTKINVNISPGQDIKVDVASNEGIRDKRPSWFNDHSGTVLDVALQKPITLQSHNQFNKPHLPETPSNFMKPPPLPHEKRPSPVLIPLHLDLESEHSNEEENEEQIGQESNQKPVVPVEFVQPPPLPNYTKQPSKIYDDLSSKVHSVGSVSVENFDNVAGESNIGFGTLGVGNIDLTHSLENKKHPGEEKIDQVVSDDMRPPPPPPSTQMTIPKLDLDMESNSPKPYIRPSYRTTTKTPNQNAFVVGLSPPPKHKPYIVTHRPNIHISTKHPTTIKYPQTSYHFQTQTTTTPIPITTHRPSYSPRPTTQKYRPYTEIFRTTSEKYRTTAEKYRTTTESFRATTLKPSIPTTYISLNKTTLRTRPKPIRPFIIGLLNNEQVRPTQPKPKPSNSEYDLDLLNKPIIQPSSVKEFKKSSSVHIVSNDKWNLSPSISEEYEDVSKISTSDILPSKNVKLISTALNPSTRKTSTYTPLRSSTVSPSRIKYHHSSDFEVDENYETEVVTGTHKPELISKVSKKVEKTQSLPTRYITHTQTLTVTTTETTVISSAGQKPSTMTLVMTKTHTSTIIDTVTHTLVRPTSIVATVTTTVSASHHPILNEENNEQEGESFFVVVNDHKLSNINLNTNEGSKEILTADGIDGEEIIANVDEGDNSNEVNHIIQGGVLLAFPPRHNGGGESCKPDCSPARNEQCHRVAGQLRCVCRPGFARMFPDRPCMPTYTYSMKLLLARQGPTKLRYSAVMKSLGKFTQSTKEGLDRLVMQSELRDIYHGVAITQFDPLPEERDAVIVNYYVQLSENIDDHRLSEVFKTSLRTNNFSLGGTDLYADKSLQLVAEDFDECISKQFHDCSENAQCFNLRGTYTCSCQEGHTDLSENTQFPGRVCSAEMIGCERCNFHGTCYNRGEDQEMCECFQWYAGEKCHINLKALLIALVTLGAAMLALLLLCTILTCVRRGQPTSRGRPVTVIRRPHKRLLRYRAGVAVGGGGGGGGSSRLDQRAMIHAGDSSSEASLDNPPISYMQPILPAPPAASSLSSKLKKAPVSSIGVVKPTPTLCFAPDQRDRSLTVMIPRAKYRPAPQPPVQPPPAPPPMATFSVDQLPRPVTAERKLIAYLEQQPPPGRRRAAAQAAAAAAAAAAANTASGDQTTTTITSPKRKVTIPGERDPSPKKSPTRKASSGALISAGFEVSATVGRKSASAVADTTNTMLSNGSNMTTLRTTDSSIVKEPLDDDSLIEAPATGLQELTVSEARSCDETTVQPPTKCVHANYNHDEAGTMAERDLGSTFLLPHTQLYKPDKGSDVSNFDSL